MDSTSNSGLARLEEIGVVGAGGGGFPTAAKLRTRVSTLIVNAAECEPLLHKDKELLLHHSGPFFRGLSTAIGLVGATDGIIGIKNKYSDIIAEISRQASASVRVQPLSDSYPAGDEFILVHDLLGRVIPPGGLPRDVDAVVVNVETLVNIGVDRPVTHKYLTVAGAMRTPMTLRVPVGMAIGEVIAAAGGADVADFGVLLGGVMMAKSASSLDEPVTKTTGGIVVLPSDHKLLERYRAKWPKIAAIGRSACDQCSFCTELCPRYLLGHPIQPHRAMQSLGFTGKTEPMIVGTLYCCECNLCTLYSCPEDLDPKNVCVQAKPLARERGLVFKGRPEDVHPHPLMDSRRVPSRRLIARLGLSGFNNTGPLTDIPLEPARIAIPLKQHAGVAAVPVVKLGQPVQVGDLLAAPPAGQLGARIHSSIAGRVREVDANGAIVIEA